MMKDKCWKWGPLLSLPFLATLLSSALRRRHFLFAKDSLFHFTTIQYTLDVAQCNWVGKSDTYVNFILWCEDEKEYQSQRYNVSPLPDFIDRSKMFLVFQLCKFKKKSGPQLAWFEAGRGRSRGGKTRQSAKSGPSHLIDSKVYKV